jgi:hypothetical protein
MGVIPDETSVESNRIEETTSNDPLFPLSNECWTASYIDLPECSVKLPGSQKVNG